MNVSAEVFLSKLSPSVIAFLCTCPVKSSPALFRAIFVIFYVQRGEQLSETREESRAAEENQAFTPGNASLSKMCQSDILFQQHSVENAVKKQIYIIFPIDQM